MGNGLTKFEGPADLPLKFALPALPADLEAAVEKYGHEVPLSAELVGAAEWYLPMHEAMLAPPALEVVRGWLFLLAGAVSNTPLQEIVAARLEGLWECAQGVPHICWTREKLRESLSTTRHYLPSVGDIIFHVQEGSGPLYARVAAMRNILKRVEKSAAKA